MWYLVTVLQTAGRSIDKNHLMDSSGGTRPTAICGADVFLCVDCLCHRGFFHFQVHYSDDSGLLRVGQYRLQTTPNTVIVTIQLSQVYFTASYDRHLT